MYTVLSFYGGRIEKMSTEYSDEIMSIFSSPNHIYQEGDENHLMGFAGDASIGEYIHLYFQFCKAQNSSNYADSKIVRARFSAVGGVLLIVAAEKFCSLVEGLSFQDALKYCDPVRIQHILSAPNEKIYSVNFVIQAFYKSLEALTTL